MSSRSTSVGRGSQQLDVVRVEEVGDGEQPARAARPEHVAGLVALEARVERDDDAADRVRSERGDGPLVHVRRPDGDAVAGLDAAGDQRARGRVDLGRELGERQPHVAVDDAFTRAEQLRRPAHHLRNGLRKGQARHQTVMPNSDRALSPRNGARRGSGNAPTELVEVVDVLGRVVGVREVGRPQEPVAEPLGQRGDRALVGIARDPDPVAEVVARLVLERHPRPDEGVAVHGVDAVEPVADPSAAGLEHDHLQPREPVEHAVVEQRRELLAHAVRTR